MFFLDVVEQSRSRLVLFSISPTRLKLAIRGTVLSILFTSRRTLHILRFKTKLWKKDKKPKQFTHTQIPHTNTLPPPPHKQTNKQTNKKQQNKTTQQEDNLKDVCLFSSLLAHDRTPPPKRFMGQGRLSAWALWALAWEPYKDRGPTIIGAHANLCMVFVCVNCLGLCYPVCGMVHIKEALLLIWESSLCGGSGFPFALGNSYTRYP